MKKIMAIGGGNTLKMMKLWRRKKIMKKEKLFGIALDDGIALEVIDGKFRILASKKGANGYRVYCRAGRYYEEKMEAEHD